MKDTPWGNVIDSAEDDSAIEAMVRHSIRFTLREYIVIAVLSIIVLGMYVTVNQVFYPQYPVITDYAEQDVLFVEHYPPFRMDEWNNYTIAKEIIHGKLYYPGSVSQKHPIGFSLCAVPLTKRWGERGVYFTNAIILWLSNLIFFAIVIELVPFSLAVASTLIVAFASPNLFYSASGFLEPLAQLFLLTGFFFFMKGIDLNRGHRLFFICGFTIGLNLFVQPFLAFSIVFFLIAYLIDQGRWSLSDPHYKNLFLGFFIPLGAFLVLNRLFLGKWGEFLVSTPACLYDLTTLPFYGERGNLIHGFWKLLFDGPHGIIYLMPIALVFPLGLIVMWRHELHTHALLAGFLVLFSIVVTAFSLKPVTGESVGVRQLVPIFPLLVLPIALVWREGNGEKIWIGILLLLTVYMCSFGWWTGSVRGGGLFIGVLHDESAQSIILARKHLLNRPHFSSSYELTNVYFSSLSMKDIQLWLQTLDPTTLSEINNYERTIFHSLCQKFSFIGPDKALFIESVDPNTGVRPILPYIDTPSHPQIKP